MDSAETMIFYFCNEKKFYRFGFVMWTAVILMFFVGVFDSSASLFLLGIISGLNLIDFLKPEKLVISVSFNPSSLEIKTMSGSIRKMDFKNLKQVAIFPRGSNRLLVEWKNNTKETYNLGRKELTDSDNKKIQENRAQFANFTNMLNEKLSAFPETVPFEQINKKSNPILTLYNILSFLTGSLTLIAGSLIFLAGIVSRDQNQTYHLDTFLVGSVLALLGILAIAKQKWSFILLVLVIGYRSFSFWGNNSINDLNAKLLLLMIGILSLLSFFMEFFSRKFNFRK